MPRKSTFSIRPTGWDKPQEEWRRFSPLDTGTHVWNNWALIFEVGKNLDKRAIVEKLQRGLEATVGQCRHIAGTIEKNEFGDFSIVTKPDSTVAFVVQWFDSPEDQYPSFSELEKAHFCSGSLGDPALLSVHTRSSEASPNINPTLTAFQLTFIPGGMILNISIHHWAMDSAGLSGLIHQLAANCYSLEHGTSPPAFDESLMDRSRFIRSPVLEDAMVDPPPPRPRHPDRLPCAWLLFHIPLSKAAELKRLATPTDGSWISTYDAVAAFLWRVLSKNRAQIYKPDLGSPAIFGETVDMRNRVNPPVSNRYQGNMQCGGLSIVQERPLTLAEVISDAPLSDIAAFIRKVTNDVNQDALEETIARVVPVRDKTKLHKRLDCLPPMSLVVTDWRAADVCAADFGFGRLAALRQPADEVLDNLLILYPRRTVKADPDHGLEVVLPFEKHAVDMLINDPDMNQFFTFWGFEAEPPSQNKP